MIEAIGDEGVRTQYRIDQLIEEAISSSLIEGAKLTTRAQAKAMIRDERAPTSHGEKMVLNNYRAMKRLLEIGKQSLTLDDLLEIHSILGDDALDSPNAEGRLRTAQDNVRVEDATRRPLPVLQHLGFQALASTSGGAAWSAGVPDMERPEGPRSII